MRIFIIPLLFVLAGCSTILDQPTDENTFRQQLRECRAAFRSKGQFHDQKKCREKIATPAMAQLKKLIEADRYAPAETFLLTADCDYVFLLDSILQKGSVQRQIWQDDFASTCCHLPLPKDRLVVHCPP